MHKARVLASIRSPPKNGGSSSKPGADSCTMSGSLQT
jgi:hypothetical protein